MFNATKVEVYYKNKCIITGHRTPITGLWHIPLAPPPGFPPKEPQQEAPALTFKGFANAAHFDPTKAQQVAFSHATLFSPPLSTLQIALNEHWVTGFPGLNSKSLRRHPPQSKATTKGHMDQIRQGTRSTKPKPIQVDELVKIEDIKPPPLQDTIRSKACFATMMGIDPTGKIYTDQTGRLPVPSSQGMNYIFVMYVYDPNYIHMEPMKNRSAGEILAAFQRSNAIFTKAGFKAKLHRLDNECSQILKDHLMEETIDFQLAPPGSHRRNAAERAIRTAKNHLIAALCSTDPNFPLHLWCRLLPQANITLNLLRGSRVNPKLSAYAQVHGVFDFNRTPLAPPGTLVLGHEKPDKRGTWSPHAIEGWYVGPAMDSYRCYKVWCKQTRAVRTMDTVEWFPRHVPMPTPSSTDRVIIAAQDLAKALQNPCPNSPLMPLTDHELHQLDTLQQVLTNRTTEPTPPLPQHVPTKPQPTKKVAFSPEPPTVIPKLSQRSLRRRRQRVAQKSYQAANPDTTKEPIAHRVRRRRNRPVPNLFHKANAARKKSAIKRRVRATMKRTTSTLPTATAPKPKQRSARRTRHIAAAITIKEILLHRLESLLHTNAHPSIFHTPHVCNAINVDTGREAEYKELRRCSEGAEWEQMMSDEIGKCAQGNDAHPDSGTNTFFFIHRHEMPARKKATYARIVAEDRPHKEIKKRIRLTVGGDKIDYPGDVSTKTSDLTTVKILFNSVISTPDAEFMTADIKDFYLNTPMEIYEYMRIRVEDIPADIINRYELDSKIHNGFVYVEIRKGMYGLPQSGKLANDRLCRHLAAHGYHQSKHTPGLFHHVTRPITFTLVVDDFGIKYVGKEHAQHLIDTI